MPPPAFDGDLPVPTRHLDQHRAQVLYSDRVWGGSAIGRDRIKDAIEIARIARGVPLEQIQREPSVSTIINTNSPRRVDKELLSGLMEMAENGQVVCVTPFTLAGAMSPITIAGALALQSAEALGVLAFVQMVKPGCPMIFGGFTSNVDMKTGAPAFGTPEFVRATIIGGQIARRYKLPYRASNVNSSNAVDAQATYESDVAVGLRFEPRQLDTPRDRLARGRTCRLLRKGRDRCRDDRHHAGLDDSTGCE